MTAYHPPLRERDYLFPGEAAQILGVSAKAVNRYVRVGLLTPRVQTLGGHARFDKATIYALRDQLTETAQGGPR